MAGPLASQRVDWVDYAKGLCIIMVVMMHSTLGVEKAIGEPSWLHGAIEFARPFRMPDFFLIAGLFLARVIDRDWRDYGDRKVVHFAYFYALWITIQFALRAPGMVAEQGAVGTLLAYLMAYIEPFGTMWFIYLLPVFFVVTKLLRPVPVWLVLAGAAVLEMAPVESGWLVIDEFAGRYVYFFAGYAFAPHVFRLAVWVQEHAAAALGLLGIWALINGGLVYAGLAALPGIGLFLGGIGACAVVAASTLFARARFFDALRYCGQYSLVVYLAFSPFMAATRVLLLKTGVVPDPGSIALLVTFAGVAGPLLLDLATRKTPARWLFLRPAWARLAPRPATKALRPAV
jgi:uncharacterized membrane protein YcfT